MKSDVYIRDVQYQDAASVHDIYRPYVEKTAVTFEEIVPDVTVIEKRIVTLQKKYPWYVAEVDGSVAGYAYASSHKTRDAYRWSADVSVYVSEGFKRIKIGYSLYSKLMITMSDLGYYNLYGGITLPNEASVRLHEKLGFKKVGVYKNVGYKCGKWHDVGWWGKSLSGYDGAPKEPVWYSEYRDEGLKSFI